MHGGEGKEVIGHPEKMEITVLGDSVNLAAKLEKHTKKTNSLVLVDRATYEQARRDGYVPKGSVSLLEAEQISGIPTTKNLVTFSQSLQSV